MVKHILSAMFVAMGLAGGIASAETIQGFPQNAGLPGLVEITIQGDPIPHTGILVSPNLALTSGTWFASIAVLPKHVTIAHGHGPNRIPQTKVATDIWLHPRYIHSLALVRVASGFSGVPAVYYENPIKALVPAVGADLVCYGFSQGRDLKRAELRVKSWTGGENYVAVSRARTDMILNDGAGIPCFLAQNGQPTNTLTGIAERQQGGSIATAESIQLSTVTFQNWIPNMIHLSKVRSSTGTRAMSLYTRPDPNNPSLRMCLDIASSVADGTIVNQQPCNGSPNQLFYFHNFPLASPTHFTIVHSNSGMCLTIPNSSTNRGVKVQQSPCNQGLNQDWEQSFYQPRPPEGIKFLQKRSNLCLSAPPPPNSATNGLPVEQNSCLNSATNFHQRWFIQWK